MTTDNEIDGAREDLLANDHYFHCCECHQVTPMEKACSLDGYLYCQRCVSDFDENQTDTDCQE